MNSAIDAPKSKSITIVFLAFKSTLLGIILSRVAKSCQNQCESSMNRLSELTWIFYLLGLLLDIFCMIYFLCTPTFSRLEYYVFYGFHTMIGLVSIFLYFTMIDSECDLLGYLSGAVMFLNLLLLTNSLIIMMFNLYFVLKFAHFGCNILWTFMSLSSSCNHFIIELVGLVHGLLSTVGVISFVVMGLMKKTSFTSRCWKQFYIISIIAMIICYLLILLAIPTDLSCSTTKLYVKTYEYYGLVEIVSPICLLVFMRTQMGDPRDKIIKKDANVFIKSRQNQNFQIGDNQ